MNRSQIDFENETEMRLDQQELERIAEVICGQEQPDKVLQLSVLFCESDKMQFYNRQYRGQDKATDILSFTAENLDQYTGAEMKNVLFCDIIIDTNQVNKQKGTNSFEQELKIVFIHGILHLMGYDHIRETEKIKMEEKEVYYHNQLRGVD
ncbi:MAG: rRNA maturation RNase YbeY [Candidatus Cloacimonetes bacterium HGW-Cloacimonetes-1]|nr:MAG: rRNA maturation RNase YbeY [Candidatus Cloacimonetes bacterium HGW-Cloacimonetes-1]